jgi:hypothetical protein
VRPRGCRNGTWGEGGGDGDGGGRAVATREWSGAGDGMSLSAQRTRVAVCWLVVDCGSFAGPTAMTRIPRGLFAFVLYYWAIEKTFTWSLGSVFQTHQRENFL